MFKLKVTFGFRRADRHLGWGITWEELYNEIPSLGAEREFIKVLDVVALTHSAKLHTNSRGCD